MDTGARWQVTSGQQDPGTVERLLGLLPHWFGLPESNAEYVAAAHRLQTYLARPAGPDAVRSDPIGVLLAMRHFPEAAEIYFLAVDPSLHRQGAGRALVAALEADLLADGCLLLQVKTRGPSRPDAGYELTRSFYAGVGFWPLEEMPELWDAENPCLIMVKVLAQRAAAVSRSGGVAEPGGPAQS